MPRCAVLGSPIAHSLSPVLHRAAYADLGLADWTYDAIDVSETDLAGFVGALGPEWQGLSLTMPLKREAMRLVGDRASSVAVRAGAANTLIRLDEGWWADNTDVPGAAAAIRERTEAAPRRAAVLGGGATAGSMVLALESLGCEEVVVMSRSQERSSEALGVSPITRWAPLDAALGGIDLLASTIPAEAQTPDLVAASGEAPIVFEVVYGGGATPLARAARDRGAVLISGLDLLVHQAVLQVSAMTSVPVGDVPMERMRAAGLAAMGRDG